MTTSTPFRVAAIQTVSTANVADNLASVAPMVADAARQGAGLIMLPEYFGVFGNRATDKVDAREPDGAGVQQDFLRRMAREHGVWMLGGTVPIETADPLRVRSALLVYDPQGHRVARYDKIHLFAFSQGSEKYDEARTIERGTSPATFDAPFGRVGLSICYDLRFPELYRAYRGVALIVVPSAFTATTGAAHWQVLLQARAIENQCYVLAAAQGGLHANGRRTFGHSVLIDPWGVVIAELAEGPGVVIGDIDPARVAQVRADLPALQHRLL